MDNVKKFFEDHPASNVVFETSDKLLFREDGDAGFHARGLEAKTITTHLREVVMVAAETETMPVIDKIVTHNVDGGTSQDTITAQSLQPAVTGDVKDKLATAEKATGAIVTNTEVENGKVTVQPEPEVKAVTTATGAPAANSPAAPATAPAKKGKGK